MTRQQLVPPAWLTTAAHEILEHHARSLEWVIEQQRRDEEQLRRAHPWRWRRLHARRWVRRRVRRLARLTPIRWVGFGHDWDGRWEW